jgi:hypothetical protein
MLAGQQAYRQYCRREKEIQPPQSPGVTAANFSAKFFAKFFRRELGGVPRDRLPRGRTARPPTGPRSGSDASDHPWGHARWSVADVDAILATLDRLYAMAAKDHPGASEFLIRLAWLPPLLANLERPRLDA